MASHEMERLNKIAAEIMAQNADLESRGICANCKGTGRIPDLIKVEPVDAWSTAIDGFNRDCPRCHATGRSTIVSDIILEHRHSHGD